MDLCADHRPDREVDTGAPCEFCGMSAELDWAREANSTLMQLRVELEEARSQALIQITEYQEKILRLEEENERLRASNMRSVWSGSV